MLRIRESFTSSLETAKKLKILLYLVVIIYIASYIAGYIIIQIEPPAITGLVEPIVDGISTNPVYIPIISAIETGNVAFAIAYTFTINLASGAFASTTLPGIFFSGLFLIFYLIFMHLKRFTILSYTFFLLKKLFIDKLFKLIPLLGTIIIILVTGFRGFIIGAIFTYTASMESEVIGYGWGILALGTLILELGAYVFSAAAGINISLSIIFPSRYQTESRRVAFKEAWKDAGRIYILVIILLALGAIWEMGGIYILTP